MNERNIFEVKWYLIVPLFVVVQRKGRRPRGLVSSLQLFGETI